MIGTAERLVKYVMVEIIVLWWLPLRASYVVASLQTPWFSSTALWFLLAGIVAVPLYLWKAEGVCDKLQIAISIVGFVLFAFALGVVPLSALPGYNRLIASVALPVYVFVSPWFDRVPDRW